MLLAFELSGEHPTLPKAEVMACLHASDRVRRYEEREHIGDILVLKLELEPEPEPEPEVPAMVAEIGERLGMTHRIYEILGGIEWDGDNGWKCEGMESLIKEGLSRKHVIEPGDTFAVRVRVKGGAGAGAGALSSERERSALITGIEREAGAVIKRMSYHGKVRVDLNNPKKTFVILLMGGKCLFTLLLHTVKKKVYEERKPHLRPFFSPGVIMPRLARVLVNLSRVRAKELLLDPFCGTGGILIEAGMVAANPLGMDIQAKMVRGAHRNMLSYRLNGELAVADATKLPLSADSVDAIVTDLPYGRVSLVSYSGGLNMDSRASFMERLYEAAVGEMHRVLKRGRNAVIVFHSTTLYSLFSNYGFNIRERHEYRVHRSLIRYIAVLEKK